MDDYIKREDALNTFSNAFYSGLAAKIKSIPTADVAPVRHAKWADGIIALGNLAVPMHYECSMCLFRSLYRFNYCPNCGAKMDGESE